MKKAAFSRFFVILFLLFLVLNNTFLSRIIVNADNGPITIWGEVYTSDGKIPPEGHDGAYAAVILKHDGETTTWEDPDGIQLAYDNKYVYAVTIPDGKWAKGDTYWVKIDGEGWGDLRENCCDHDNTDEFNWKISQASGNERRDVNTVNTVPMGEVGLLLISAGIILVIVFVVVVVIFRLGPNKK